MKMVKPMALKMKANPNPEFPHSMFPIRLEHMEGKDLKDKKICFFDSKINMEKYVTRSKLKKSDYLVYEKDIQEVKSVKKKRKPKGCAN